jgi:hypothetical protein
MKDAHHTRISSMCDLRSRSETHYVQGLVDVPALAEHRSFRSTYVSFPSEVILTRSLALWIVPRKNNILLSSRFRRNGLDSCRKTSHFQAVRLFPDDTDGEWSYCLDGCQGENFPCIGQLLRLFLSQANTCSQPRSHDPNPVDQDQNLPTPEATYTQ